MKPVQLKKDIYWIGAVDYNKRNFHGYSRSPQGTTYNSFLITDEKNVIFDTVDMEYFGAMLCRLGHVIEPEKIDYIVVNHTEKDHAGCLSRMVERCHPEKIFTSAVGKKFMEAQFDTTGWPLQVVKTGDVINIGKRDIHFVETRMLHWPDSMVSYVAQDKMLISNDIFGQNIGSSERFADQYDRSMLLKRIKEYYYNIVLPYSPQTIRTLDTIAAMKLDIEIIAPDHGLIYRNRDDAHFIMETYRALAEQKPQARGLVIFDSMWGSTEAMATSVGSGMEDGGVPCRVLDMRCNHHSDVMTEMADCGALAVGSPTHNNDILPGMSDVLTYMRGLRPKNRIGGAFGSFGWSGEASSIIHKWLADMGMEMPVDPIKTLFVPTHENLVACHSMGKSIAEALKIRCNESK